MTAPTSADLHLTDLHVTDLHVTDLHVTDLHVTDLGRVDAQLPPAVHLDHVPTAPFAFHTHRVTRGHDFKKRKSFRKCAIRLVGQDDRLSIC